MLASGPAESDIQITEHCPSRCRIYRCDRCKGIAAVPPLASYPLCLGAVITSDMGCCECLYLHEGVHTISSSEEVWTTCSCCYGTTYSYIRCLPAVGTHTHAHTQTRTSTSNGESDALYQGGATPTRRGGMMKATGPTS